MRTALLLLPLSLASCMNPGMDGKDTVPGVDDSGGPDDTGDGATPEACGYTPMSDLDAAPDVVEVDLTASALEWDPGTGVPLTSGMAFNGSVPGPVLEANLGDTVKVHFTNDLDI